MLTTILAVPVSASIPRTNESASSANFVIEDYSLAEFAEHLQSDPMILQISLRNNELTYIATDGTHTTVSKEPAPNGTQIWTVNENGKVDKLGIDVENNEIILNGSPVDIAFVPSGENRLTSAAVSGIQSQSNLSTKWYPMGNGSKYNLQLDQQVRSATSSLLYTLLFSLLKGVGVVLSIAQAIIGIAASYQSPSTAIYVFRRMYRDTHYLQYKYVDKYYFDASYKTFAYQNTTIVLSAN